VIADASSKSGRGGRDVGRMLGEASAEHAAGRLPQAAALFEAALKLDPNHAEALYGYAVLALQAGQPQAAASLAQRAVAARGDSAEAHQLLGVAQRQCGRLAEAIVSLEKAVRLRPEYFEARLNLGNVLLDAGDAGRALAQYERALALDPGSASAHNNLGNLYRELRKPAEAIASYRRAVELYPRHAMAHANLANVLRDMGDSEEAIAAFRHSLSLSPNQPDVWSNLLLTLSGSDRLSPEAIYAEHVAYGDRFAKLVPARPRPAPEPMAGRRLRIGYVSSDFRSHAVATFLRPLLAAHDADRFEIFCYYNYPRGDDVTEAIRAGVEHFVPVAGTPDRALAERIARDRIDVLVDLNGHSADNRLTLFLVRPAPVQVTWLGYPGTTGIATIDYRLTDRYADPPGLTESLHTEALWRLPATAWCYRPYDVAPAVAPSPCQVRPGITFTCLNGAGKTSPTALSMWADILSAVPGSRLQLLASPHEQRMAELKAFFTSRGVAQQRIDLVERRPLAAYLALYRNADIALDSHPYTGATTTCDALWMGVPVVTLAGNRPFTRSGASLLNNVGLPELIATTREDYVRIACALAADRECLSRLGAGLRERMRASRLTDAGGFARDLEEAFSAMCEIAVARAERGK